jgi:hypothetical protein
MSTVPSCSFACRGAGGCSAAWLAEAADSCWHIQQAICICCLQALGGAVGRCSAVACLGLLNQLTVLPVVIFKASSS